VFPLVLFVLFSICGQDVGGANRYSNFMKAAEKDDKNLVCKHDGVARCDCKEGWNARDCSNPIDYCTHPATAIIDNVPVLVPLCEHGKCRYSCENGSWCDCDEGWLGKFCDQADNIIVHIATRCILYDSVYTKAHPDVIQHHCNNLQEDCLPDVLDALKELTRVNTTDHLYHCPNPKKRCEFDYPIGWCLPRPYVKSLVASLAKINPKFF
jgi:hypothetical protein